ncbi:MULTISPECIES: hypothetical protein [unclassified Pseudoalteromonas]|jgi:hypothetical protein|nr:MULTISPECIES: hypothetical protein [unclassified Pseudoalteromonas]
MPTTPAGSSNKSPEILPPMISCSTDVERELGALTKSIAPCDNELKP